MESKRSKDLNALRSVPVVFALATFAATPPAVAFFYRNNHNITN